MSYKNDFLESILHKEFKVLDKGYVKVIDYMGNDEKIADSARISYGKGTRSVSNEAHLIRYLIRHRHTTPLEQNRITFEVKVPMDCWRQWIRHRTMSVNEYSTRYSEAIDDKQTVSADQWRLQSGINKQGSSGVLGVIDGKEFSRQEKSFHDRADEIYKMRIDAGIAREVARKDLPLSTYTKAVYSQDLHNLLHFLSLRMDSHAQLEIRNYATVIGNEIVANWCPSVWRAFQDYRLNAIQLSARDIEMIKLLDLFSKTFSFTGFIGLKLIMEQNNNFGWFDLREDGTLKPNRERQEFEKKIKQLNIKAPWIN